jgi:hypothetical protein
VPAPPAAKSPLREILDGVPSTSETGRFSTVDGYFESPGEEEEAHSALTPAALRIIKRREALRASDNSISQTPPELYTSDQSQSSPGQLRHRLAKIQTPDYYEDTNFVEPEVPVLPVQPEQPTIRRHRQNVRRIRGAVQDVINTEALGQLQVKLDDRSIRKVISADSFSDIPQSSVPEQARELEKAWDIKQRKASLNSLENRPKDHGLTELFAQIRIPPEEH